MKLERYKKNPILRPQGEDWESRAVFNPGVIYSKGKFHMLYRAVGAEIWIYLSRFGYAWSRDGIKFKRKDKPVFVFKERNEAGGVEDPRITKINNKIYMTYVAVSKLPGGGRYPRTALAVTKDFKSFKRLGVITPAGAIDKDGVLFPKKINGRYAMLQRPHNWITKKIFKRNGEWFVKVKTKVMKWPFKKMPIYLPKKPSTWVAFSDDLIHWKDYKVLLEPKEEWEKEKIGAGAPPIKTKKGWLLLYHGVSYKNKVRKYKAGAALLDLESLRIIGKTKEPILEPEEEYEIEGDESNVVFPEGAVVRKGKLYVYYGGADKYVCLATCNLKKLLDSLSQKL